MLKLPDSKPQVAYVGASERVRMPVLLSDHRRLHLKCDLPGRSDNKRPQTKLPPQFNQAIGRLRKMYRRSRLSPGAGLTREVICSARS